MQGATATSTWNAYSAIQSTAIGLSDHFDLHILRRSFWSSRLVWFGQIKELCYKFLVNSLEQACELHPIEQSLDYGTSKWRIFLLPMCQ